MSSDFEAEISTELHLELSKLCTELHLFLNKTQSSLLHAKQNFKQAENVIKPWEISNKYDSDEIKCLCSTLSNIPISENNEDTALLNTISKTLSNAELIRKKSLKTNVSMDKVASKTNVPMNKVASKTNVPINKKASKTNVPLNKAASKTNVPLKNVASKTSSNLKNSRKSSENTIKTTKSVNKCTLSQSASTNNFVHNPCCPLFETSEDMVSKKSLLNLSDALRFYKIPSILSSTIRHSNIILCNTEKPINLKTNYKDIYFQSLERQIADFNKEKDTFCAYLSALNSYEKKRKNIDSDTWLFYKDIKCLEKYQTSRCNLITEESWITILNFIRNELIPVLQEDFIDSRQKLYLFKMLKTICNFVYSTVPCVPIFRIEMN